MMPKRRNGLTDKQEKFCQARAAGMNQSDAYRSAYDTHAKPDSVRVQAHEVGSLERVKARIAELQEMVDQKAVANVEQIAADLYKIASDETKPDGVRLKAYDQLTKIQGGYTDSLNVSVTGAVGIDGIEQKIAELLDD